MRVRSQGLFPISNRCHRLSLFYKSIMENGNRHDIGAMTFEEAMDELESIVRALEDGRGKLDEAIASYEGAPPEAALRDKAQGSANAC